MSTLRILRTGDCNALKSLLMSNCTCLEYATIEKCDSLTFISRGKLLPTLKRLEIKYCEKLLFVVDEEGEVSSLHPSLLMNKENLCSNSYSYGSLREHLEISDCPSLKCLWDLPTMLKHLEIHDCLELTSLSSRNQLPTALKRLVVRICPKLESAADKLHNNACLKHLEIWNCEKLKSLPEGLHKLYHLNKIDILGCSRLVSFPDGGALPTSLRELSISNCEKLEALPNLTYLEKLTIRECPSITSFPEEGYPTNLTSLSLSGMNICKQVLFEWGLLHRLMSLRDLWIDVDGGFPDWKSFPEEEDGKLMMMMPSSLTTLWICDFPNIVFLSLEGFRKLSAIEQLWIWFCPKLASLPDKCLPPSLLELDVIGCPILKKHCKKGKGQEWFKIAHIPRVQIDGRSVYELEEEEL